MESSLFIAVKTPTPQHLKKLRWMLSDDAPIFEEEVAKKWQAMFNAVEEMTPDEVLTVNDNVVVLTWLCGDWEDSFKEHSASLLNAGFSEQSAYYWADENEGYLTIDSATVSQVKPKKVDEDTLKDFIQPKKWNAADKRILKNLIQLLK